MYIIITCSKIKRTFPIFDRIVTIFWPESTSIFYHRRIPTKTPIAELNHHPPETTRGIHPARCAQLPGAAAAAGLKLSGDNQSRVSRPAK